MLQLDRHTARKLGRRLRRVTTRLGNVRELDVLLILIDELHVSGRRGAGGLGRVGVRVAKGRDEARKKLFARLPVDDMTRLARKLDKIVDQLRDAEHASSKAAVRSWRWAIDARVAGRASRLSTAMTEAGALYLPERLHGVRIAAPYYLLRTGRDGARGSYYVATGLLGLVAGLALGLAIIAAIANWRERRSGVRSSASADK